MSATLTPTQAAHEVIVAMCAALPDAERRMVAEAIGGLAEIAYAQGKRDGAREAIDRMMRAARDGAR